MAPRKKKLLSERIRSMAKALGGPSSNLKKIKGDLTRIADAVLALESDGGLADAKARIEALETEIKELKAANHAQRLELKTRNSNLCQILEQLKTLEADKEPVRRDQNQEEILQILPVSAGAPNGLKLSEISARTGISQREALTHLRSLVKENLALEFSIQPSKELEWARSDLGNEVAIRLKKTGQAPDDTHKYNDLPEIEGEILLYLRLKAEGSTAAGIAGSLGLRFASDFNLPQVERILDKLESIGMAISQKSQNNVLWTLSDHAHEYLKERWIF